MKKTVLLTVIWALIFVLSSCTGDAGRIFDYQDSLKSVSGTYRKDGAEYSVTLYFEMTGEGDKNCRRIEYSSPESLAGLSFTLEGENITAELEGVRIADSWFLAEDVFFAARLFSLSEDEIYEIKSGEEGTTVARGKNENEIWQAITNEEGMPVEIIYEDEAGSCEFEVEKIETKENDK